MLAYFLFALAVGLVQSRPQDVRSPTECPAQGHYLLPHEWDCTKFYYCEYGVKWETARDCSPGTEFSFDLQVCIHPALANCQLPGVPPPVTEATTTEVPTTTTAPSSTEASVITTTTAAPTTTTEAPTTTAAPTTTTEAPTTTAAPTTTTEAPTTTAAPTTTTEAPTTTAAPTTTTEAPTTTAAPTTTTEAPTTTAAPTTTTEAPTTTAAPTTTTEAPTTTAAPTTTTEAPTTTAAPTTTTEAPATEEAETEPTEAPSTTTSAPVTEENVELLPNGCPADFSVHQLLPHETECNLFYYCNFGEKVVRECPLGTHFNPTLQVCDWPENAGCANSGNGEDDGTTTAAPVTTDAPDSILPNGCPADFSVHQLLPHETECNLFYYCNFGEKVVRECAPGTHFNPTLQVCDWPENAGCANSGNGEDDGTTTAAPVTTDAPDSILPNGCPADFSVHQLLPHETECNLFYYCNFGEKVVRECPLGTHFNPTLQVCDWPENAGCANSGNSGEDNGNGGEDVPTTTSAPSSTEAAATTTTTAASTTEEAETEPTTSAPTEAPSTTTSAPVTEENVELLPNGCPADFSVHQLLPHETECNLFYYCNFGEKVVRECPLGTHFNPTLQVCDWPENAGCANSGNSGEDNGSGGEDVSTTTSAPSSTEAAANTTTTAAPTTTSAPSSTEAAANTTTSAPVTEENVELLPNGCPADFSVYQLLPHETECNLFYYCNFGEKVVRECAPGTHFNPTLQVCDWPENAGCANAGNSGEDNGNGGEDNGSGEGDNGNGGEDNGNGGWLENGCPADPNIHYLLPHESECSKFYYCVHGNLVERQCPAGTHFNPTLQVCDWPDNAGCANSGNSSENATTSAPKPTTSAPTEQPTTSAPVTEESGENGNGGTEEENAGIKCAESCNVQPWGHATDCDKFWRCDGGKAVLGICSEGLHFNANTLTCDFICNANCARDDAQTTIQNDGVRIFLPWDKVDADMLQNFMKYKINHH